MNTNNSTLKTFHKNSEVINSEGRSIVALTASNKPRRKPDFMFSKSDLKLLKNEIQEIKEKINFQNEIKGKDRQILLLQEKLQSRDISLKKMKDTVSASNGFLVTDMNQAPNNKNPEVDKGSNENLLPLILDLQCLIVGDSEYEGVKGMSIKNKILQVLSQIHLHLTKDQSLRSTLKEKEKHISIMKAEIEELRHKENNLKKDNDELTSTVKILEKELKTIKSQKDLVLPPHLENKGQQSTNKHTKQNTQNQGNYEGLMPQFFKETTLAKENADLRRRLEKSCMFILKKKEKITKLSEKLEASQKKIEELINAKNFLDNEDTKIKESLLKKSKIMQLNFKTDYDKKTLDFKIDKLKEKYRELLKEIIENGTEEFIKHFFLMNKPEQEHLISFISDQMLSYIDYSKRLNKIVTLILESFQYDKDELIKQIRVYFNDILEAERVTLWVLNPKLNEYQTIVNNNYVSESSTISYFQNVIQDKFYKRSKIDLTTGQGTASSKAGSELYSAELESHLGGTVRSVIATPIRNTKGEVVGIIEAVNSNNGLFGFDEEYLLFLTSQWLNVSIERIMQSGINNKVGNAYDIKYSVIAIMKSRTFYQLQLSVESEVNKLLCSRSSKIIYANSTEFYRFSSPNNKVALIRGGVAQASISYLNGLICRYPNESDLYNPTIDIDNIEDSFYSIPLVYKDKIFAVLQFEVNKDQLTQYRGEKNCQPSKLDNYRERLLEFISEIINAVLDGIIGEEDKESSNL